MLIGVQSQTDIYHLTSILQPTHVPHPLEHGDIECGEYQFFVFKRRPSKNEQILLRDSPQGKYSRILIIDSTYDEELPSPSAFIVHNVEELEELMVLDPLDNETRNKLTRRVFHEFTFEDNVLTGFNVLQGLLGRPINLAEFINGGDGGNLGMPLVAQPNFPGRGGNLAIEPQFPDPPPNPPTRTKRVREETCLVCMSEPTTILLNCGHECMCKTCADIWLNGGKSCPICRETVTKIFSE